MTRLPDNYAAMTVEERAAMWGIRPFAPLAEDHPIAKEAKKCPICRNSLIAGEVICLLVLDSEYNRQAAAKAESSTTDQEAFYAAEATPTHWACVTWSERPLDDWANYERKMK